MRRKCPNCAQKTIPVLKVMLWNPRCKNCGLKVCIDPFVSWLADIILVGASIGFIYYTFEIYGLTAIAIAIGFYTLAVVLVEMFGPLKIRGDKRLEKE